MGLLNPGGPVAQFKRNRCSISPVELILQSGVRTGFGGLALFLGRLLLEHLFLLLGCLVTGSGKIHHLAKGCLGGIALVRGGRLLGLLLRLGLFGSGNTGRLRGGGLRYICRSRLFSRNRICRNRLGLVGSGLPQRGERVSLFYLGADILFIV